MQKVLVATFNAKKIPLEKALEAFDYQRPVVVRMGGLFGYEDYPIQINSIQATSDCIDKYRSKQIMIAAGIPTLPMYDQPIDYPFVIKGRVRSRGSSVFLCENEHEFRAYAKILSSGWYIEPLFDYTSEYRLHCSKDRVFFAVKKQKENNDVFINANNHTNVREFLKPRLWTQIQESCINTVKAHKLDIGAIDVGYCSNTNPHTFIIHEINTSPELRKNTFDAYVGELDVLIREKQ